MGERRRLAFVTPRDSGNEIVGGAEMAVRLIAEHAAARGAGVELLTTCAVNHITWRNSLPAGVFDRDGIIVRRFPARSDRDMSTYLQVQRRIDAGETLTDEDEQRWIDESIHSDDLYDYLERHLSDYDAVFFSPYLFGLTVRGIEIAGPRGILIPCLHDEPFARLRLIAKMFDRCGGVFFHSEPEALLAQRLCGADPDRSAVVGVGFDPFTANGARFREAFDISEPIVLYCGRREGGKNVPLLIDYFHTWAERSGGDARLVVAGSGAIQIPRGMEDRLIDVGYLDESDKRDAMAAADVFAQPSVNESFSIVLMEAWLAGSAVLVHGDCAATRHHCSQSGGGLWFEDYPEFEACVDRMLADKPLRDAMTVGGRAYVEREYTWPAVMDRFDAGLAKVIDR